MRLFGFVLSFALTSSLFAVDVRFSGACADGTFDAQGADVEYSNLNLDLLNGVGAESAECVITTSIPAKSGFTINVSEFKAEGFAEIEGRGLASMFVNHRFNGQIVRGARDIARNTSSLVVFQRAVGVSSCGDQVVLRTKLTTKASNAVLLQDSATSNTVRYKVKYVRCR